MEGLRVKLIEATLSKSFVVVVWDFPDRFPDNYTLVFRQAGNENKASVFNLPGVSFLYIMTIILKTNQ